MASVDAVKPINCHTTHYRWVPAYEGATYGSFHVISPKHRAEDWMHPLTVKKISDRLFDEIYEAHIF